MRIYIEAHRQAQQMKASGASKADLEDRAARFDDVGQYSAAAAFRAVVNADSPAVEVSA